MITQLVYNIPQPIGDLGFNKVSYISKVNSFLYKDAPTGGAILIYRHRLTMLNLRCMTLRVISDRDMV